MRMRECGGLYIFVYPAYFLLFHYVPLSPLYFIHLIIRLDVRTNECFYLKVLSGAAPLRGLSNIGSGLHDLLVIPMTDYRKKGGSVQMARDIKKKGSTLLHTVAREALHATSQITMLLARGIQELVRDPSSSSSPPPTGRSLLRSNNGNRGGAAGRGGGSQQFNQNQRLGLVVGGGSGGGINKGDLSRQQQHQQQQQPQPADLAGGLRQGLNSLSREVAQVVETVVAVSIRQYQRGAGPGGGVSKRLSEPCRSRCCGLWVVRPRR